MVRGGIDIQWTEYFYMAKTYVNSVGGSFVWGHTYYPVGFEIIYGGCWLFGAFTIATLVNSRNTLPFRAKMGIFSGAQFFFLGTMFGLIARIAAAKLHYPEVDAFLKPRLTAPGIAVALVPMLFFFNYIAGYTRRSTLFLSVVGLCLWQAYYAIKVYLSDAF